MASRRQHYLHQNDEKRVNERRKTKKSRFNSKKSKK